MSERQLQTIRNISQKNHIYDRLNGHRVCHANHHHRRRLIDDDSYNMIHIVIDVPNPNYNCVTPGDFVYIELCLKGAIN